MDRKQLTKEELNVALQTLSSPTVQYRIALEGHQEACRRLSRNPTLSKQVISKMTERWWDDQEIIKNIASSLSCDQSAMLKLVQHPQHVVRLALAGNPQLSRTIAVKLSLDQDHMIRKHTQECMSRLGV